MMKSNKSLLIWRFLRQQALPIFMLVYTKKMWDIVGENICGFVLQFFNIGVLPEGVNDILLALIPKVAKPEMVTQLRPISLCNISYKIITKAMMNRLKKILPKIISPNQSSFIPRSQVYDNVIIYQEVLHTIRIRK